MRCKASNNFITMQNFFPKKAIFFLFLLFDAAFVSAGKITEDYVSRADSLFEKKKYTEAFQIYETLFYTTSTYTPQMLLKMAYVKEALGEYTYALYYLSLFHHYEADEKVLTKMRTLAESKQLRGYNFNDYTYLSTIYHRYYKAILLFSIIAALVFLGVLIYRKIKKRRMIASAIAYTLFLAFVYYFLNHFGEEKEGIVVKDNVLLMSAPSAGASLVGQIKTPGHRLQVLGKSDIWYKVRWESKDAYLRKNNFLLIE